MGAARIGGMIGKRQFSLRSVFLAMLWIAITLGLLRLLPFISPARLVTLFAIHSSQQAPFVLLVPGALLCAAAAAFGAAIGTLHNCSIAYAVKFSKLTFGAMGVYFAIMAWVIWPDNLLTFIYTIALFVNLLILFVGRPRFALAALFGGPESRCLNHNARPRYKLRILLIAVSVVPPVVAVIAFSGVEIVFPIAVYLTCIALIKHYVLADNATFLRERG
jgi:hypothetical protein